MSIIPKAAPKKANRIYKVTSGPAVEPITADEVKTFGRIDGTDEDTLIEGFIVAAREAAEKYLRRALITQTIKVSFDWWPGVRVELPRPPLQSITKVETLDEDDTATEYSSSQYFAVTEAIPGMLVLKDGVSAPENTDRYTAGYRIEYVAGYGDAAANVPRAIREGLKLWVMDIYENRVVRDDPPPEARPLLDIYRVIMI